MHAYQLLLIGLTKYVVERCHLECVFLWLSARLQDVLTIVFAGKYKTRNDERVSYSLVNIASPRFNLDPKYAADARTMFPWKDPSKICVNDHVYNNHFMIMCAKLAYEDSRIVEDVVSTKWGMKNFCLIRIRETVSAYLFTTERAVVVVFQGTEPLNLAQIIVDAAAVPTPLPDGKGGVHYGFYTALVRQPDSGKGGNALQQIQTVLNMPANKPREVFVTGHSLGGAFANVFCQLADPAIQARMTCITFGQPRTGDTQYRDSFESMFERKNIRFVHAADIVPKALHMADLRHVQKERFVTKDGRFLDDPEDIEFNRRSQLWLSPLYSIADALGYLVQPGQRFLQAVFLVSLIPIPGLGDHFPSQYEHHLTGLLTQ